MRVLNDALEANGFGSNIPSVEASRPLMDLPSRPADRARRMDLAIRILVRGAMVLGCVAGVVATLFFLMVFGLAGILPHALAIAAALAMMGLWWRRCTARNEARSARIAALRWRYPVTLPVGRETPHGM